MTSSPGRGARRRRAIVAAAAELFAHRGYPSVGMDDIGAAAGVTGPAIYRHFGSKAAVLAAVIDGIIDAVVDPATDDVTNPATAEARAPDETTVQAHGSAGAPAGAHDPDGTSTHATSASSRSDDAAALARHVTRYAAGVAERRELMAVFVREVHHLPGEHAERLRHRQRALVARWRTLLAAVHPDWSAERVRTSVHAAFGMLNAVGTFTSPLTDHELGDQLTELTLAALELPTSRTPATPSPPSRGMTATG